MSQSKHKKYAKRRKQRPIWPRVMLAAGGLVLILAVVFAFSQSSKQKPNATVEVSGSPSLKVDKETVDLGKKRLGQQVKVSFQLTNVGDQPLRFASAPTIEVKEGC
jgi:cell division septal protein FtsQ